MEVGNRPQGGVEEEKVLNLFLSSFNKDIEMLLMIKSWENN